MAHKKKSIWFLRLSRPGCGRGVPVVVVRQWQQKVAVASSAVALPVLAV